MSEMNNSHTQIFEADVAFSSEMLEQSTCNRRIWQSRLTKPSVAAFSLYQTK